MALTTPRVVVRPAARGPRSRRSPAVLLLALLLVVSACGMDAQTSQPYTPAEGVNVDVGRPVEWCRSAT